jgi:F420-0:gamma-glutamyl ligase
MLDKQSTVPPSKTAASRGPSSPAAAELVMGKTERRPFVIIGGFSGIGGEGAAQQLVRDSASDLFR